MSSKRCFSCGQIGHIAKNCPSQKILVSNQKLDSQQSSIQKNPSSLHKKKSKFTLEEYVPDIKTVTSKYVDSHMHFEYLFQKLKTIGSLDQFFREYPPPPNFDGCISVFCDPASFAPSLNQWRDIISHPQVWGAFGIHPHSAKYYNDKIEEQIVECLKHLKAVAWGECGLDFHYNNSPPDIQKNVFARQLQRAVSIRKPIVVHSRKAEKDTLEILKANVPSDWPIHIHCFTESAQFATSLLKDFKNLYFGFTGIITLKNADDVRQVVQNIIPLDRLVLETDAPYITPHPFSGICHSGLLPVTAQKVAELKGVSLQQVFETSRQNTVNLYRL